MTLNSTPVLISMDQLHLNFVMDKYTPKNRVPAHHKLQNSFIIRFDYDLNYAYY